MAGHRINARTTGKPHEGHRLAVHDRDVAERFADQPGPAQIMMTGQQQVPRVSILAALDPMQGYAAHRLGRRAQAGARAVNGCHGPGSPQPPRTRQPRGANGPVRNGQRDFGLALAGAVGPAAHAAAAAAQSPGALRRRGAHGGCV